MKTLDLKQMEMIEGGKNGQDTLDCVNDAYTKHGWVSLALWGASALGPAGIILTTYACAVRNI